MAKCGAKTKAGGKCIRNAMENGRCHYHGGKSTGPTEPPIGNQRAVKHGIYLSTYTAEEIAELDTVVIGGLEAELFAVRVQLKRAMLLTGENARPELVEKFLGRVGSLEKQHAEITGKIPDESSAGETVRAFAEAWANITKPSPTSS